MRKKILRLICVGLVVITSAVMLGGCVFERETPAARIERIYDIELPKGMHVLYNHIGSTFTGRAEQYVVFELQNEPTDFLGKYSFIDSEFEAWNNKWYNQNEQVLRDLIQSNIPDGHRPDLSSGYFWQNFPDTKVNGPTDFGSATIIYSPDELKLTVILRGR